jgi:hypothetical protein
MQRVNQENIFINGDGDAAYEKEVLRLVNRILLTKTGQAIAFKIRSHGAVFINASDAKDANASTAGSPPAAAVIEFYPNTNQQRDANVSLKMGGSMTLKVRTIRLSPGFGPDEVLFHEMVHAARLLGNDDGAVKEEEFFAVLVANIYISEKGKSFKELRYRYDAFSRPMTEAEVEPFIFLMQKDEQKDEDHFSLIEKFCRQHTKMAPMIAKAPAKFNPIRDYYQFKENLNDFDFKSDEPPGPLPIRITQNEAYVSISDDYLIGLLEPRFRADDVAGYGQRAQKLDQVFASLKLFEATPLIARLVSRRTGDRVAMLFHGHLATATRARLINILRTRITK